MIKIVKNLQEKSGSHYNKHKLFFWIKIQKDKNRIFNIKL